MDLKQRIKGLGLTHIQFGKMLGVGPTTVSRQINQLNNLSPRPAMVSLVVAMEMLKEHDLYEEYLKKAHAELAERNLLD